MDQFPTEDIESRMQQGLDTARRLGASEAKLVLDRGDRTHCKFEAGRLKDTGRKQSTSYGVEVLVGGRKGNTAGNRLEDLKRMIERAVTLAKVGSIAHFDAYPAPGELGTVKTYSEKTRMLSREKMIEAGQQITDALKDYDANLYITCAADRAESETFLVTSGGVIHRDKRTHWELRAYVQRTIGKDMLFAGYGRSWRDLNEFFDPGAIADRVIADLRHGETMAKSPRGKVPVYLPPESVAQFLWPIFMGTNGRNAAKGDSPLAGRLNQAVLAPSLTLIDDPHRDYASGARVIDNNGIPTKRQTIIEQGRLKRFLYDLDSAGLAGTKPTGNNDCSPYSPVILPGSTPSSQLLRDIRDGLYVRDLIGFGQSNIINGDFSGNVGLGYQIKNGEIVGRVKNTMISGNLYQVMKQNVLVSSDTEHEGRYPHMVVEGVSVSSP